MEYLFSGWGEGTGGCVRFSSCVWEPLIYRVLHKVLLYLPYLYEHKYLRNMKPCTCKEVTHHNNNSESDSIVCIVTEIHSLYRFYGAGHVIRLSVFLPTAYDNLLSNIVRQYVCEQLGPGV